MIESKVCFLEIAACLVTGMSEDEKAAELCEI
jgi:hypothetical protein